MEKEIKVLKKLYHKHKEIRVNVVESDLIEISWKHTSTTVRLDLSSYPDGILVPFSTHSTRYYCTKR